MRETRADCCRNRPYRSKAHGQHKPKNMQHHTMGIGRVPRPLYGGLALEGKLLDNSRSESQDCKEP